MNKFFICGQLGDGTKENTFRPECVDEFPPRTSWSANRESPELPRFVVHAALTDEEFADLAYDADTNPNGFDWVEVDDNGGVIIHAAL
jgi:hypothetical protein